jgi:hypothetical protein
MGYEASLVYDPHAGRVIRWAGHNQGGGGEQNAETWTLDPATMRWELKEPNTSPPGACCAQQNLFDPVGGRMLRFPAFSGNHGWQWFREIDLNDSSVWSYHLTTNTWRNLRPLPTVRTGPLRCASWDAEHQVALVFGGEGNREGTLVYDPYTNAWTWMQPRLQPDYRSGGNLAYDPVHRVHVLFGAQFTDDPHTWTYDLHRDEWRDMRPATQPPTNCNDAVLAYDAASRAVVAVVRVVDDERQGEAEQGHLETWTYDAGLNTWTRKHPAREPDGWHNRRRILVGVPDRGLVLLENFINASDRVPGVRHEQQIWSYRNAPAAAEGEGPAPPALRVTTTRDSAILEWPPARSGDVAGYIIERGEGAHSWLTDFRPVGQVGSEETSFEDRGLLRGTIYHYNVRAAGRDGKVGRPSQRVRTQPPLVDGTVASVESVRKVRLTWDPVEGQGVVGYHVERAAADVLTDDQLFRHKRQLTPLAEPSVGGIRIVGSFERLTREPVAATSFVDASVDLLHPPGTEGSPQLVRRFRQEQIDPQGAAYRLVVYVYRVRAVNALGVEGGDAPLVPTIPSAPQWVFSREDGRSCRLKWGANPESGLRGYRVYRMDGPRTNGPGQPVRRLTLDPVAATRYTDETAGGETKRYWIVAVDALGQEGFPSAPVWYEREYRAAYAPFVGEWHQ